MGRRLIAGAIGGLLIAAIGPGVVVADDVANSSKSYHDIRIDGMKKNFGENMRALSDVAKGVAPLDASIPGRARKVAAFTGELVTLFPEGSGGEETRAKPEIWQRWDEFTEIARTLGADATRLAAVAEDGDGEAFAAQLQVVGKNCGTCHDTFRKPKD